jgi:hypothetical protein
MKKLNLLVLIVFVMGGFSANAQVEFKLAYDMDTERYTVSVIPMATYVEPQNITGTGQVTVKVPTNNFDPVDIESHLEGMYWEANSRNNSPEEAPEHDYISFGLSILNGIAYPEYIVGEEIPLFSFENAYGCTGKVAIMNNQEDAFMPPNSQSANVGNALTILGAGGDAYHGIVGTGVCDCAETVSTTAEELGLTQATIYPNPAAEFVNVEINWEGEAVDAHLQIVDATGKMVHFEPLTVQFGRNDSEVIVSQMPAGNYFVYLTADDWKLSIDKFTKQ